MEDRFADAGPPRSGTLRSSTPDSRPRRGAASAGPVSVIVPWYEAPEFRALAEARRAFTEAGIPTAAKDSPGATARLAVFWTLYELGYLIDEMARCTRDDTPAKCSVSIGEHSPRRVVIELAIHDIPDALPTLRGAR